MGDAHEAIRNLLGRYCELIDAGDFEGLGHLFAEGRLTDEHGTVVAEGREGVLRLHRGTKRYDDGTPRTRHMTTNTIIEIEPGGARASARSSYVVFQATEALPLQPIITGRYRDSFVVGSDRRWRFEERSFAVDHVGDLSHHLRYEIR